MKPTIGFSIIAHNEEKNITKALESIQWADDIVVVDCDSTDKTVDLAQKFRKVRIFHRPNIANLNINKTFGISQLNTEWIFYLDPDEYIPSDLQAEIISTIPNTMHNAFKISRKNFFFGKWLKHGGQYPDYQIRLFRRGYAYFPNRHVHESLVVKGSIGYLKNSFEHYPYNSLSDYLRKMDFYTSFQAKFISTHSKHSTSKFIIFSNMLLKPLSRFFRRYILKLGFLDGWEGIVAALGDAFQISISYAKYLELINTHK